MCVCVFDLSASGAGAGLRERIASNIVEVYSRHFASQKSAIQSYLLHIMARTCILRSHYRVLPSQADGLNPSFLLEGYVQYSFCGMYSTRKYLFLEVNAHAGEHLAVSVSHRHCSPKPRRLNRSNKATYEPKENLINLEHSLIHGLCVAISGGGRRTSREIALLDF